MGHIQQNLIPHKPTVLFFHLGKLLFIQLLRSKIQIVILHVSCSPLFLYINTTSKAYPQCIHFSPINSYHLCLSYHNLLPGLLQQPPKCSPCFCSCHAYNLFSIQQLKYLKNANQNMSLSCLKPTMTFPPEFKIKSKLFSLIYKSQHGLIFACVSDFTC